MSATNFAPIESFIPPDFFQKLMEQASVQAAQMLGMLALLIWQIVRPYLPLLIGFLFFSLVVATIKAMFGRWGSLGSLLYHIFYFGLLGIVIWIKGWGILLSDYFDLITALLYPLCYWLTGLILQRFKRSHYGF